MELVLIQHVEVQADAKAPNLSQDASGSVVWQLPSRYIKGYQGPDALHTASGTLRCLQEFTGPVARKPGHLVKWSCSGMINHQPTHTHTLASALQLQTTNLVSSLPISLGPCHLWLSRSWVCRTVACVHRITQLKNSSQCVCVHHARITHQLSSQPPRICKATRVQETASVAYPLQMQAICLQWNTGQVYHHIR